MGTSSSKSKSTTQNTPSALETGFDQSLNNFWNNNQSMISGVTGAGGALAQSILGGQALPGAYSGVDNGGSSLYGVDQNAQNNIINQSMRSVPTSLQATGMLDSGASQALYQRGSQNVGAQLAQFNTSALQNAAGIGSSVGTASMAPAFSAASMLTSLLPGLRTSTTNSSASATQPLSQTIGQLMPVVQSLAGLSSLGGSTPTTGLDTADELQRWLAGQQGTDLSLKGTSQER